MNTPLDQINVSSDTWLSWITKDNDSIGALSNNAVVVAGNSAGDMVTGNGFVVGILGANTIVASTLRGGNVTASGNLTISGNVSLTGNIAYSGAVSTGGATVTTTGTSAQIVDRFALATFRTGKYIVSANNNTANGYQSTEIMLIHDGTNVLITEYASLASNGTLGVFTANTQGANVNLIYTPAFSNVTLSIHRTFLIV